MTLLREGDLEVEFVDANNGRKFDEEYGLSHCMKAVDFIVEFEDRYLFIEFKDPSTLERQKRAVTSSWTVSSAVNSMTI